MRWVRSWPAGDVPPGRAHVVDELPRLVIADYDYTPLGALDDDVCLIEWDMALSLEDRLAFERSVSIAPAHVLVAPYRLYLLGQPVWAHRRVFSNYRTRWVMTGETHCELFSFGLIYLPRALVRAFLAAPAPERGRWPDVKPGDYTDSRFTDQTFSTWHLFRSSKEHYHELLAPRVRIAWHVNPVHLHYQLEGVQNEPLSMPILQHTAVFPSGL